MYKLQCNFDLNHFHIKILFETKTCLSSRRICFLCSIAEIDSNFLKTKLDNSTNMLNLNHDYPFN